MSKVKIQGNASGTGVVTLTAPNTNTDRTITLPDGDISLGVGIDDNATSTAITIDASENVEINTGNLVIGTSGKGIDFSAATPDGTGSTGSEVLDDYEEGTWTPTFLNTTVSAGPDTTTGRYTKIGNTVHVAYYGASLTLSGGSMVMGGLPFTVASASSYSNFHYVHGTASSSTTTGGYFTANNTTLKFIIQDSISIPAWVTGSSKYLMISGTYTVA